MAGYDSRLTPDLGGFLQRTKRLIEDTYRDNGNRPVHLVGHSNGPIYAQYLLTHTSRAWKRQVHPRLHADRRQPPGPGLALPAALHRAQRAGLHVPGDAGRTRASSARMYLTAPSSYMSVADPRIFGSTEIVVRTRRPAAATRRRDYRRLFPDAGLAWVNPIADHYIGFVKFADPAHFPHVDVYAEKGSGIDDGRRRGAAEPHGRPGARPATRASSPATAT